MEFPVAGLESLDTADLSGNGDQTAPPKGGAGDSRESILIFKISLFKKVTEITQPA